MPSNVSTKFRDLIKNPKKIELHKLSKSMQDVLLNKYRMQEYSKKCIRKDISKFQVCKIYIIIDHINNMI